MATQQFTHRPFAKLDQVIKRIARTGHGQRLHNGVVETDYKVNARGFWSGPQPQTQKAVVAAPAPPVQVPLWSCVTCKAESKQQHQKVGDSFPIDTMCAKCRNKGKVPDPSRRRPFVSMKFVLERYGARRGGK